MGRFDLSFCSGRDLNIVNGSETEPLDIKNPYEENYFLHGILLRAKLNYYIGNKKWKAPIRYVAINLELSISELVLSLGYQLSNYNYL
jgi:hypothetical protein